jgi:hypothetical protein
MNMETPDTLIELTNGKPFVFVVMGYIVRANAFRKPQQYETHRDMEKYLDFWA